MDDGLVLGVQEDLLGERQNSLRYHFDHLSSLQDEFSSIQIHSAADGNEVASGATACGLQGKSCDPASHLLGTDPPDGSLLTLAHLVFSAPQATVDTPLLGTCGPARPSCGPPEGKSEPPPTPT